MGNHTFQSEQVYRNKIAQVQGLRISMISMRIDGDDFILTIPDRFDADFIAADGSIDTAYVEPNTVSKLTVVDRLEAAGLFETAMAAMGGPGDLAYERWSAASIVESDNADVRALLVAIGADLDVILAPETGV